MRCKFCLILILLLAADFFFVSHGFPQDPNNAQPLKVPQKLTLTHTVMCEEIKDYAPYNSAVVFSIAIGKVSCFTSFDPVPEKTFIYHEWYYQDKLSAKKKLYLQPPRWSTYSSIQLRETDKGPWRVQILDHKGNLLDIVRFSITD
ncbi:MAG TPA: DUF2914 domain-containing protein [Anaerolineae bacterium]|nr:DUF2914 domain-containing protein [Anaerolineae bacterium]